VGARAQLSALEVLSAVRRVGADFVVGIRSRRRGGGGSPLEDAVWFGERFAAAGADYLSVSRAAVSRTRVNKIVGGLSYRPIRLSACPR
jgi:2,4-dienoyl-CoA reductase-like NADH-dependent reductase (Old Yellow Enzyme family)